MLFRELLRFSTQHRTFYCYMILSIWIFLLIAGMYKYMGRSNSGISNTLNFFNGVGSLQRDTAAGILNENDEEFIKFAKFKERCTPLEQLERHEDGGILEGWKLQGVLLVIRHGDRGPMSHMRAISQIDCGIYTDALVNRYRSFIYNTTTPSNTNHMYWNKVGPFHGFPLLPASDKACHLGQLTYKGIAQLLHLGEMLHQIYAHPLGLVNLHQFIPNSAQRQVPTPLHSLLNSEEVTIYTTRYRRTFQSALALLYTFLPNKWLSLNIRESHSMSFCFTDCACFQAEILRKHINTMNVQHLAQHNNIDAITQWIGSTLLLQNTPNSASSATNEVVDAMLTVLCHDAPLPCRSALNNNSRTPSPPTMSANRVDMSDVINIDQDDNTGAAAAAVVNSINSNVADNINLPVASATNIPEGCIERSHVSSLMSYAVWQSAREVNHAYYKRIGLLRAYGMIRHIVSYMLKMISGDRTKFVLYSGHDWTLQYLTAALGIHTSTTFIPYAARLAIELYKSEAHTDYYFRVVYNGYDVTQQIDFCLGGKSLRVTRDSRGKKADLCPIENIIRFLHEDYFAPLNATNFKDACAVSQRSYEF